MNTWLAGIAGSAATALVLAVLTKLPGRIWRWVRARVAPDHRALAGEVGSWTAAVSHSTTLLGVRVRVVAAPARSLSPKRRLDLGMAVALLRACFAGFPETAAYVSPTLGVRFEHAAGVDHGYAWVYRNGRIDLDRLVAARVGENGRASVPVLEIVRVVDEVRAAVSGPGYVQVFGRRARLPWRRRFDWYVGVSTWLTDPEGNQGPWGELIFPGRSDTRLAPGQNPDCPPGGYARGALRNWPLRRGRSRLLAVFLKDFLEHNGYQGLGVAVQDTVSALPGGAAGGT